MKLFIALLSLSIFIVNCSKDDDGPAPLPALTGSQLDRVTTVAESITDYEAVSKAMIATGSTNTIPGASEDATTVQEMWQEIRSNPQCKNKVTQKNQERYVKNFTRVSGSGCQVRLTYDEELDFLNDRSSQTRYEVSFAAKKDFRDKLDVYNFEASGVGNASFTVDPMNTQKLEVGMGASYNGSFSGTGQSESEGEFQLVRSTSSNISISNIEYDDDGVLLDLQVTGEAVEIYHYVFKDFQARIERHVRYSSDLIEPEVKIFVNGVLQDEDRGLVGKAEYDSIAGNMDMPGVDIDITPRGLFSDRRGQD